MTIRKICILGLEDYAMLTGDTAFGHIGGESVQHVLLARAWREMGIDVSIVVYDHGQPRVTVVDGIRAVAAFSRAGGVRVLRFVHPRLTRVIRVMREVDADVYYQSPAAPWSGVVAYFANRVAKRSIIRIASDSDCLRGQSTVGDVQRSVRNQRDRWMFDYGVLNATLVAAQTVHQRELLARNYGVQSEIVNIAAEVPRTASTRHKDVDVLWVGNMRPVKRPDLALELARRLPRVRFALVGGAVPGGDAYFERIANEANALPNVAFVGPVSYQESGDWFDRSHVHLNTSDYEGFPNTFLQAWARRVPVTSFCDPDGLIRRRGLGRRCADIVDMQVSLAELLSNPTESWEIGSRAHAFAASEFSAQQTASRYLDLLESGTAAQMRVEALG